MDLPGNVVEVRELWGVAFRETPQDAWKTQGTEIADAAAVLRIYDYWQSEKPEWDNRILKTVVTVSVEDEKLLREKVEEDSAVKKSAGVPSE